ncbi:MAG TPA: YciI family protein [Terrimicrobiaceae bacterium]
MKTTSDYLLLFRGTSWHKGLSPAEIQRVMTQWRAWYDGLEAAGTVKGGLPLLNEGKVVSGIEGRLVADGPFAESKEAIGGYFLITAADLEEAVAVAKQCPGLTYGASVEVRPVAEECAAMQAAREAEAELEGASV